MAKQIKYGRYLHGGDYNGNTEINDTMIRKI